MEDVNLIFLTILQKYQNFITLQIYQVNRIKQSIFV